MATLRPEQPDKFAKFFTLDDLKKRGYLDVDKTKHPSITYDTLPLANVGIAARKTFAPATSDDEIHPVFRHSQWTNTCSVADYDLLKSSLRLVTRFIEHPDVAVFLTGLMERPVNVLETHPNLGELYTFKETVYDPAKPDPIVVAWRKCCNMRKYVTLSLEDPGNKHWARASSIKRVNSGAKHFFQSNIKIHPDFLRILRGQVKGEDFPEFKKHGLDEASVMLRATFYLAEILIHEFCHSISHVNFQRDAHTVANVRISEPFVYGNQRVAEVGHAFEQFVFGGVCMPMCTPLHPAAPYGLMMRRFPGLMYNNPNNLSRGSARKWGVQVEYLHPVHMDYVAQFFEKTFWDNAVTRFGNEVFKYKGQKTDFKYRALPVPGERGFWAGETMADVVMNGDEPRHT